MLRYSFLWVCCCVVLILSCITGIDFEDSQFIPFYSTEILTVNDSMVAGGALTSPDSDYELRFEENGNLIIVAPDGTTPWESATTDMNVSKLKLENCRMALFDPADVCVKSTPQFSENGSFLTIQTSGNLAVYNNDSTVILWNSNDDFDGSHCNVKCSDIIHNPNTIIDSVWFNSNNTNPSLTNNVIATINDTIIMATVPHNTDISSLTPSFILADTNSTISPKSNIAQDFNSPVIYTVTAENGSKQIYTLSVNFATPSSNKNIASISFLSSENEGLVTDLIENVVEGEVNIHITTERNFESYMLTPTFTLADANASIDENNTQRDFSNGAIGSYTVTAQDNTTQTYNLTVTIDCGINRMSNDTTLKANFQCATVSSANFEGKSYTIAKDDDFDANKNENLLITTFVSDMSYAFQDASLFPQNMHTWDVSDVVNMRNMFKNALNFNEDISKWDVSKVTNMREMFRGDTLFNQNIGGWNVSKVTNMRDMFRDASTFDGNIGSWDVYSVTNMLGMFRNAKAFDQNLNDWNVQKVKNMSTMFRGASVFNGNINNWEVKKVTNMNNMFRDAIDFNANISNWEVVEVTNMSNMFRNAQTFNQNIGNWNVDSVKNMSNMFRNAKAFNQNIGNWNVAKVTNMNTMFRDAIVFDQNIGNWKVDSVENMNSMFRNAKAFSKNIGNWNVAKVTNMNNMFRDAESFNQDISSWIVSSVTSYTNFNGGSSGLDDTNIPIFP